MLSSDPLATFRGLTGTWYLDDNRAGPLAVLLCFAAFLLVATFLVRGGRKLELRSIPGLDAIGRMIDGAAECGQAIHFSPGTGLLGGRLTADTLAGLAVMRSVTTRAANLRAEVIVTTPDPVVEAIGQGMARQATKGLGASAAPLANRMQFVAPEPLAYAAGVMGTLSRQPLSGNIMLGALGDEYLLMGQAAVQRGIPQVIGSTAPETLPFIVSTANNSIMGEEVFAGPAYLEGRVTQKASLLAQDWLRELILLVIVGLVLLRTIGSPLLASLGL